MGKKNVWCVGYWIKAPKLLPGPPGPKDMGWCATSHGRKPSDDALSDKTACGFFVSLRIGTALRRPTCKECKAKR